MNYVNTVTTKMLLSILAKNKIFGLNLVENTCIFHWFRVERSFLQLENDILLCGTYMPSSYTTPTITPKTDSFGKLHKILIEYKDK